MKDKIDERDFQEHLNSRVIKSYNVHYITMEEAAQSVVKIGDAAEEETKVEASEVELDVQNVPVEEELPPSAYYGMVDPDEETINRMQEIMKDREEAVKEVFTEN